MLRARQTRDAMSDQKGKAEKWRLATKLVRGGTMRSQFGETSEALFMTSDFRYDSAEAAEARFKNEQPGFVYSRFSNPTVEMFETRMALLEGAEAARGVASAKISIPPFSVYFTALLIRFIRMRDMRSGSPTI